MSSGTPLMENIAGSRDGHIIAFQSWWNKQKKSLLLKHFAESASDYKIFDKSKVKCLVNGWRLSTNGLSGRFTGKRGGQGGKEEGQAKEYNIGVHRPL